jgi:sensor histidine kinase regulating citrate/malate metabolism
MICLILEVGTYIPLANLKYLKSDGMPLKHWFAILGVPVLSLVLIIEFSWNLEGTLAILGSLIIFFINIIVFYLYNDLLEMVFVKQEREVLGQQMEMYSRQYKQMENTIQNTRRLRHDMKNLLIQIEALADGQHQKELLELIGDMVISLEKQYEYSNSGNVVLDSILNYKLGYAKNKNMQTNLKIQVPSNMNLSAFDMTVLLGNLLDNAIEATELVETNPYIDVEILYEFGMLYIKVKNSYAVELPGEETTLKRDKQNHGIGLQSVKSIVDKYQGNIKISKERDIYQTEIWLPNC